MTRSARPLWRWLVAGVGVAGCVLAARPPHALAQTQAELDRRFLDAWRQQPRCDEAWVQPLSARTLPVAAGGAKVVILKFNDWMCPGCKYWYEQLEPVLAKYRSRPNAIMYLEKDWPWNAECNANLRQTIPGHEASCAAAVAVRLAAERGKRQAMVEWLYANQPQTAAQRQTMVDRVKAKTAELLGVKDFAAAYVAKLPEIKKDINYGMAVQVRSTPTYFINGIRAAGPDGSIPALHYIELAIQDELKRK